MADASIKGNLPKRRKIQEPSQVRASVYGATPIPCAQHTGSPHTLKKASARSPEKLASSFRSQSHTQNTTPRDHPSKAWRPHPSQIKKTTRSFSSDPLHCVMKFTQAPISHFHSPGKRFASVGTLTNTLASQAGSYPMVAPPLKMPASSSGFSSNDFTEPCLSDSSSGNELITMKSDESLPIMETCWLSGLPSFYGCSTGSSPSSTSSFDMMDVPAEDPMLLEQSLREWAVVDYPAIDTLISRIHGSPDRFTTSLCYGKEPIDELAQCPTDVTNMDWNPSCQSEDLLTQGQGGFLPYNTAWPFMNGNGSDYSLIQPFTSFGSSAQNLLGSHTSSNNGISPPHQPISEDDGDSAFMELAQPSRNSHLRSQLPSSATTAHSRHDSEVTLSEKQETLFLQTSEPFQPEDSVPGASASIHYTDTRNAMLIEWKKAGLSYKDIKRIGGFKEAESTLRGRFRTLTKAKEQRVRKPKWLKRDVSVPTLCQPFTISGNTSSQSRESFQTLY
ncbi:hypothetical protein POX_h09842 [Penicillium oxalicum]|uniref:hypothetical protein n=1 Tax=Penicillium oxalicum TaxID=69781 RepID=UPI0020B76D6B|nr:hypothetical protein POX_h09842 [Penicillium oxalicum]KAI2786075.1 hypothetical protein POX_h09842 [Penicillium oxalicum]